MTGTTILEHAWGAVAPKLAAIRSSLSSSDHRIVRVGQLDAELLDQELAQVLQEPITKALSLINVRVYLSWSCTKNDRPNKSTVKARIEPELNLLIQLLLYKFSVWDNGGSYGAKLQDLRYVVPMAFSLPLAPSGLPRRTLLCHGTLTILFPYLHSRLRVHALSQAWPDAPSLDRRRKAWDVLIFTESIHTSLGLVNFVAFLWNGRYRTLADRALQMRLVPSRGQVRRDVSYEFMNRQMVWHAFTEFLLFLLPILHVRSVRRRLYTLLSYLSPSNIISIIPSPVTNRLGLMNSLKPSSSTNKRRGKYRSLPADQCAICAENASFGLNMSEPMNIFTTIAPQTSSATGSGDELPAYPINIPYVASCGDIYCYSCIAERLMRTANDLDKEHGWECLRCTEEVTSADRYEVEITGVGSGSDYEFSSDIELDATDMSGSIGSYTESALSDDY
ncbi:Peroxisome biogenesis factor 2 [Leucoagaricus sp. SymC.cos]|nr:Peroxisome biogenesis factor 2 [Leucoagaricus sp. SymC.cos]